MKLRKKLIAFAALGIYILFFSTTTAYADSIAVISGDVVNVRAEATTESNILKQYNSGEAIDIVSLENGWYKIRESSQPNGYAYVRGDLISIVQVEGTVTDNRVNIREAATTESAILGRLNSGDIVSVTGREGNFYLFNMNGNTGYIHVDFVRGEFLEYIQEQESSEVMWIPPKVEPVSVMSTPTYAIIESSNGVNFRKGPSTNDQLIFALPYNDIVDVLEISGEWLKVSYGGIEGYVNSAFVSLHTGEKPDRNPRTTKANAIISFAKKYLGTPYSWGGTNLNRGVDCSGFVYSVFKNFGYSLNRTSRDQIKNGTRLGRSELLPGDLVFFDTNGNGSISHVGIYIGGGEFIHSSSSKRTPYVTISSLSEAYYTSRFIAGCRIF